MGAEAIAVDVPHRLETIVVVDVNAAERATSEPGAGNRHALPLEAEDPMQPSTDGMTNEKTDGVEKKAEETKWAMLDQCAVEDIIAEEAALPMWRMAMLRVDTP